ncbi:MAG: glycosyltransferase [Rhizobiales bacterium]|nr:glycosyltransferase [Hyphomicrobiales bacterium]MBI3672819.1 glycosyltransferase [Hyphomicrobiales bacterium]
MVRPPPRERKNLPPWRAAGRRRSQTGEKTAPPHHELPTQSIAGQSLDDIERLRAELGRLEREASRLRLYFRAAIEAIAPKRRAGLARLPELFNPQPPWLRNQVRILRRSRLFDEAWYVSQYPDIQRSGLDPAVHYILIGGPEGRNPNPIFDGRWYFETYPEVAHGGMNPLIHYLENGIAEKLWASPRFDTAYYLERHPDVAAAGVHPLAHYLRHGAKEGRVTQRSRPAAARPAAPLEAEWVKLKPADLSPPKSVDVVVPVYRGYDDTLACIHSVLSSPVTTAFELVVIDDCSPDPQLSAKLRELAGLGLFTLLVNESNLGFVATANRGMALHGERDVILLNSDTVVYNDWLDRLRAQARRPHVGTATPFSTNATICSYPTTLRDNPEELETGYETIDRLAAGANAGRFVDIPTAVGFCMYVRRDCIADVGLFDVETFGRGYGEENDFCRRAVGRGWRNILAADVFVRHTGSVSFAEETSAASAGAMQALLRKHPDYMSVVRNHIANDPSARLRRRIDIARLRQRVGSRSVLHVSHNWGGGVGRHVQSLMQLLAADGLGGLLMIAPDRGRPLVSLHTVDDLHLPNLQRLDIVAEPEEMAELLKLLGVERIHVHSLAGWAIEAAASLRKLAELARLPYAFSVHDYMAFCPRLTFVDGSGRYCGEKGLATCHRCIALNGTPFGRVNATEWRQQFRYLLDGADRIIAPSRDACMRVSRYLDGRDVLYRPHPYSPTAVERLTRPWKPGDTLRLLIVGGINEAKGARLLAAMAEDAQRRKLPIAFIIVGHTDRDSAFASYTNVTMTGRYDDADLLELCAAQEAHAAFFSSVWPETYSYVLSGLLDAGYPVAAFDLGAQAERLRDLAPSNSLLIDIERAADPPAVNRALLAWIRRLDGPGPRAELPLVTYSAADYYGDGDDGRGLHQDRPS